MHVVTKLSEIFSKSSSDTIYGDLKVTVGWIFIEEAVKSPDSLPLRSSSLQQNRHSHTASVVHAQLKVYAWNLGWTKSIINIAEAYKSSLFISHCAVSTEFCGAKTYFLSYLMAWTTYDIQVPTKILLHPRYWVDINSYHL